MIDNPPTPKRYEEALWAVALRLAWYVKNHGPIPDLDQLELAIAAQGLPHPSEQTDKLLALAQDIRDHFLGIEGPEVTAMAEPSYGELDGLACRYDGNEAWVYSDRAGWEEINRVSHADAVRELTKGSFEQFFPDISPLPGDAFKAAAGSAADQGRRRTI